MKTELLRMLSPDARDLAHVGGGWASLTPEDICAALAGLPDAPYLLARSVYVADADSYRKLYDQVRGLFWAPKKPEALKGVRKTCSECEGQRFRLYTNVERTIPVSIPLQRHIVRELKASGPKLTNTMREAVAFIKRHGKIVRYPGGFWCQPGLEGMPMHNRSHSSPTINALVGRGIAEYSEWVDGRTGKFPVEAKLTEQGAAKAEEKDFILEADRVVKIHRFLYLNGVCPGCGGKGTVQLRPIFEILDICVDELFGDNKCGACGGTGLTHEQQRCPSCHERKFKEHTDLSRAKITGIPIEFWPHYKAFYQRLFTQLTDWDAQIRTHLTKRLAENG